MSVSKFKCNTSGSGALRTAPPVPLVPRVPMMRSIAVASALVAALAGCSDNNRYSEVRGMTISEPAARHPIVVSKAPVQLDIEVPRGSSGMTRSQKSELRAFFSRYRTEGEGQLIISAPSGGSNEYAVLNAVSDVRGLADNSGVSAHAVSMEPYHVGSGADAAIKVSFISYVAKGPQCGKWTSDLGRSDRNANHGNFGCAQQKNLAAVIANPRDLIHARTFDTRDSARRDVLFDKWVKGESTGAERSAEENEGTISEVGN